MKIGILPFLLVFAAFPALAEDEYQVSVEAGFAGEARSGRPLTVQVLIERKEQLIDPPPNRPRVAEGELTLIVVAPNGHRDVESIPGLALAPGDRKRIDRVVPPGARVEAVLRVGDVETSADPVTPGSSHIDADRIVVSIGEPGRWLAQAHDSPLEPESAETSGNPERPARILIAPASLNALPVHPAAYQGIDLVVVGDLGDATPDPGGVEALLAWVRSGGRAIVLGGRHALRRLGTPWEQLFPGEPVGEAAVAFPAEVARKLGVPGLAALTVGATGWRGTPTTSRFTGKETPLFLEREAGWGRVLLLTFDPTGRPIRGSELETPFWIGLLRWALEPGVAPVIVDTWAGAGETAPIEPPSPVWVLFFTLLYAVVVGPGNYLVMRALDRDRWLWVTTPLIAFGFFAASLSLDRQAVSRPLVVRQISLVWLGEEGAPAEWTTWLDFFSASRGTLRADVSGGDVLAIDADAVADSPADWAASLSHRETASGRRYEFGVEKWSRRRLVLHGRGQLPWACTLEGGRITLGVPGTARHVVVLRDGMVRGRESLEKGEAWDLATAAPGTATEPAPVPCSGGWRTLRANAPPFLADADYLETSLWGYFANEVVRASAVDSARGGVVFLTDEPPQTVQVSGLEHRFEARTLVIARFPEAGK